MSLAGLTGKVAVVTGAASGIGAATARRLAAEGAHVVAVDRDQAKLEEVVSSLATEGLAFAADVSDENGVRSYAAAAVERFGRIDLHHLNAGIVGALAPFEELSLDDFETVQAVNVRGVFLGLREAFLRYAEQDGGGAIVVTASIGSLRGASDLVPYHTSKHAVVGLTRCAAVHGGPRGVRVNAIAPGIVITGLMDTLGDEPGGGSDWRERARNSALGRPGDAGEVAALVAWLLSDESGFVTGEVVSIDGGATALNPARPSGQPVRPGD